MVIESKARKAEREEKERAFYLQHRFDTRITVARYGKESLDAGDYANALKKFTEYLSVVAEVKEARDMYSIQVNSFDPKKEITEMLMISHIYFELARLYDAVPKYRDELKKSLEQFVHFSVNQPYQVVNSEMARKYIKKSVFKNPGDFQFAYNQIYVQSKKCYVVTFCFGDQHPVTQEYRLLKDWLLSYSWGQNLVRHYYNFSSVAVEKYAKNTLAKCFGQFIAKPTLLLFQKILLPFIIKK